MSERVPGEKLSFWQKLGYGVGDIYGGGQSMVVSLYYLYFLTDVIRLNRYIRAKREIDGRLEAMRKQHNIPREAFQKMLKNAGSN